MTKRSETFCNLSGRTRPPLPASAGRAKSVRSVNTPLCFGLFLGILIPLLGAPTLAQAARNLTWLESVLEAARGNSELRAARENLYALQYTREGADSTFLPQVSGSLDYTYGNRSNPSILGVVESAKSNYSLSIAATENLFNGFQDRAKIEQATANFRISEATYDTAKARLSFDLKSAFATLVFAQRSVKLEDQIIQRRRENLKLVGLRFQSGRENKGSVLLSKAYFNQAGYHALQARNSVSVAQAQLARILGRDDDVEIALVDDIPLEEPPPEPAFRKLALLTPDHRQAVAQEDAADAAVTIARSTFFPTIGLTANAGRADQDFFPKTDRWSVGATIGIPLYNGGRDQSATKSAIASVLASAYTRQNGDRQSIAKLHQSYTGFVESIEKLKVDQSFLEAALKRSEIARSKYNNGLMTFEDWDLIENDLIARETAVLQSQKDRATAEAAWQQAQGQGVFR